MKQHNIITVLLAVLFFCTATCLVSFAQHQAPELSKQIMAMQQKLNGLRGAEDSTLILIKASRTLYQNDVDGRQTHSLRILDLESQLYDLRSRIEEIAAQISMLEAKNFESSFSNTAAGATGGGSGGNMLWNNSFFKQNLSGKDLEIIKASARVESEVRKIITEIDTLYSELQRVGDVYVKTKDQDVLERNQVQGKMLIAQIKELDQQIQTLWGRIYNYKMDTFLVMGDKASLDRSALEQLEQDGRVVRQAEGALLAEGGDNSGFGVGAAMFLPQRALVLKYELALAGRLALPGAVDSLSRALKALSVGGFNASLSSITNTLTSKGGKYVAPSFGTRSLVVYGPVVLSPRSDYASLADIPTLIVPQRGVYYTVQVAAISNKPASSLAIFKGAWPLQQQKLSNGIYRYMLGGFSSYSSAQKAVSQLLKAGFRVPTVLAWLDGANTTVAKAKVAEAAANANGASAKGTNNGDGDGYKVEVMGATTAGAALSQTIKEVVQIHSPSKQTTRTVQGDKLLFTITSFTSSEEAEVIAQIIRAKGFTDAKVKAISGQ